MTAADSELKRHGSELRGRDREGDRLTVAAIARLAGVSSPTVSRVINGQAGVAAGTRQRVEAVLTEHGYRRPERSDPVALLELVFHALESVWALEIIQGVEQVAEEHGLAIVLTDIQRRTTPGRGWLEQVLSRRPSGVVAVGSNLTAAQQSRLAAGSIPLVLLDPTGEPLHRTPSVGAANYPGAMVATRHLLELGHRRIALLAGNQDWPFCRARLDGFRAATDAAGVPVAAEYLHTAELSVDSGLAAAAALLALPVPPTAILTTNDLQAYGVYEAARQASIRIPQDLSVIGFDDLPFTRWAGPPMTTVRQPLIQMGATATRMVLALAAGDALDQHRVELTTELVIRQSTAPPLPLPASPA